MTRSLTLLAIAGLGGCVFYSEPDKNRDDRDDDVPPAVIDTDRDRDPSIDDTDVVDTDPQVPVIPSPFTFDPTAVHAGERAIVILTTGGTIDMTTIESLTFFGTGRIEVFTARARGPGEYLLAIDVPASAPPGKQDVVVAFTDGTGFIIDDALEILPAE